MKMDSNICNNENKNGQQESKIYILKGLLNIKGMRELLQNSNVDEIIKRSYGQQSFLMQYVKYMHSMNGFECFSQVIAESIGGIIFANTFCCYMAMHDIKFSFIEGLNVSGYPLDELKSSEKILIVDTVFETSEKIEKILARLPKRQKIKIFVICNNSKENTPKINDIEVEYIFNWEEFKNMTERLKQ
jgi:hypothetical protein